MGILSAFRQIAADDLRTIFLQLVQIHDRAETEVTGTYLLELGLDLGRLIEGGLLERRDRHDMVLIEEDGLEGEGTLKPSRAAGMLNIVGPFGEDAGRRPASDAEMYAINAQWLHETLMRLMKPLLSERAAQFLDPDLTLLGAMQVDGTEVPVYFARRLNDPRTALRLDLALRARNTAGCGLILTASEEMPSHLGANVVVPLLSHLASAAEELLLDRDSLELAYRDGVSLARRGVAPRVVRIGAQSGTLFIPGRDPLHLAGNDQLTIFEGLVAAAGKGSPDLHLKMLMDGFASDSPQQAFRTATWASIVNVYIGRGVKRGFWRLVLGRWSRTRPRPWSKSPSNDGLKCAGGRSNKPLNIGSAPFQRSIPCRLPSPRAKQSRPAGPARRTPSPPHNAEWRCTRFDKLLGVFRDGRMHLRFSREHEYLVGYPIQATCRGCGTLNQAAAPTR